MAKYSALKLAKDKVKKLTDDNTRLRLLCDDLRTELSKSKTARVNLFRVNKYLIEELNEVRKTFDNQVKTLKLSGDTIRELQRSRKRLKLIVRVLALVVTTMLIAGVTTL